jgi:alpha-tubulin suppressor-like RCC1 family protein
MAWRRFVALAAVAVALLALPAVAFASSPGDVFAFGYNNLGQLGNTTNSGTTEPNPTPLRVALPGAAGPVVQVAAGQLHSLALTAGGQVFGFGYNAFGQIGATNSGSTSPNPTPTLVPFPPGAGPVVQVATGVAHSLALTASGQLYTFGSNGVGQLGNATNVGTNNPNPTPTLVSLPGAVGPVVQIAGGALHSLALTATGQLYAFGFNAFGQLGTTTNSGTENANPTPTFVGLPGQVGAVTQIAAGRYFSLAATASGQLYAFGENKFGQLGNTNNNGTNKANPTPTLVPLPPGAGPVTQIAAGESQTLVTTESGQLYAFGNNESGQLGNTTNNGTTEPNPTPTLVSLPGATGPVVQAAAGTGYSMALTASGQLYGFGSNVVGQLGNATNSGNTKPNPTPLPVDLGGASADSVAASSGGFHTLVLIAELSVATGSLPGGTAGAPYHARVDPSGGTAPYKWSAIGLPDGLAIDSAGGAISGTPAAVGSSDVTVTVRDRYGIVASKTLTLSVAAAAATMPPGTVPAEKAPKLSNLSLSPRRLSLAGRRVAGSCKPPSSSNRGNPPCRQKLKLRLGFALDTGATVKIELARLDVGRQLGDRCAKATKANRKRSRCTRSTSVGGPIVKQALAGAGTLALVRPALPPGRYQLTATPSTPGHDGIPQAAGFTITG